MNSCTIYTSERYTIQSHGNGAAYTIFRKEDNADYFVCALATEFRKYFDDIHKYVSHVMTNELIDDYCSTHF